MRLTSFPLRRALVPFVASVALLTTTAAASSAALESCGSVITAPLASPVSADDPCPSTDPVVCRIRVLPMEEKVEAQRTRMRYHGLLEDMHRTEVNMRESGASEEEIARELVDMRNQAKEITRAGDDLGGGPHPGGPEHGQVRQPAGAHRGPALREVRLLGEGHRRVDADQLRGRPRTQPRVPPLPRVTTGSKGAPPTAS